MTATDRYSGSVLRYLAVLAAAAMTMSLLPLGTAFAQETVQDPQDACPEDVPPAGFTDRDDIPDVHVQNVDCAVAQGIVQGFADNTYRPRLQVRRDQMATYIAGTLDAAGVELPSETQTATTTPFTDVPPTNAHYDNIQRLKEAGIVEGGPLGRPSTEYGPALRTRRDQMASYLIRARDYAETGEVSDHPQTDTQFTDVPAGNVHSGNIQEAADADITLGVTATQYAPRQETRRDQMASFVIRLLQVIFDEQAAEPAPSETVTAIALAQDEDTNTVGDDHTVTATATGAEDAGVENANVRFEVTRDGEAVDLGNDATATTGANGNAALTYTSDEPGTDTIVACANEDGSAPADCADADHTSGELTKTWVGLTNQTFTVTPQEEATNPNDGEREYTADVGDVGAVTIELAEAANVSVADGTVTFEEDTGNPGNADFGTVAATITDISTNGTIVTGGGGQSVHVSAAEGTVTFTVAGANTDESVVPVVYADPDNDGTMAIDENGAPTVDFGIGGQKNFVDVGALNLEQERTVNRYATEHTVTGTLADGLGDAVPVDDQTIDFRVIDAPCPQPYSPQDPTAIFASGSVTTEDGVATFSYTGPEDPDPTDDPDVPVEHCIVAQWTGSDSYEGDSQVADGPGALQKTWTDDPGAPVLELTPETDTNLVSTTHQVTATAENQFGEPVADENVRFEIYRDDDGDGTLDTQVASADRTTGADGTARVGYTGPGTAADDVIVGCFLDGGTTCGVTGTGVTVAILEGDANADDTARKFWVEQAAAGTTTTTADVVGFDTAADFVDVESGTDNLRFQYDAGDQFTVNCATGGPVGATDIANFEAALSLGDDLTVTAYDPDGVSAFTLNDSDNSHPACG